MFTLSFVVEWTATIGRLWPIASEPLMTTKANSIERHRMLGTRGRREDRDWNSCELAVPIEADNAVLVVIAAT